MGGTSFVPHGGSSPVSVLQPGHQSPMGLAGPPSSIGQQGLLPPMLLSVKAVGGVIFNDVSPPIPMGPSSVQAMGQDVINATTGSVSISVP